MEVVARHLAAEAKARKDEEQDAFARSAINRFYYSCFRHVWLLHREVYPDQKVPAHGNLPTKLREGLYNRIKREAKFARQNKLLTESQASKAMKVAHQMTEELAKLLELSYAARCIADYELDKRIKPAGATLELERTTLQNAANWVKRADHYSGKLISIWKTLGH